MTDHTRCDARIADLSDQVQRSAARAIAREQEHAADLRAARGALTRLRESILAGCLDVTQARAAQEALAVLASDDVMTESRLALAAGYLALLEAHSEARAGLARLKAMERVIGMGPT